MKNTFARLAGRRALAAMMSAALITTGTAVVAPSIVVAQEAAPTQSVVGGAPRGTAEGLGNGTFTVSPTVTPGGQLTVSGTGFDQRPDAAGFLAFKLNDNSTPVKFQNPQVGSTVNGPVEGDGTAYFDVPNLPDANGDWTGTIQVPDNLELGWYWVRILSGSDGGTMLSKYAWFKVVAETETPPVSEASVTASAATVAADGAVTVPVTLSGFAADSSLSASVGTTAVTFQSGGQTVASVDSDDKGSYTGSVVVPAGSLLAGSPAKIVFKDASGIQGSVEVSAPVSATFAPITAANSKVTATIGNLPEGAQVSFIGVDSSNFLSDAQQATVAGSDNKAVISEVQIPATAANYGKAITVKYSVNGNEHSQATTTVVSPDNSVVNEGNFTLQTANIPAGLYQSAYSPSENALFVTRAVGRPPVAESTLFKIDPDTLEILAEVDPAFVNGDEANGRYAVYGIGVDDELGYVWVTNTRQNTVSVYKTSDLSLVKQFDAGSSRHSRDVIVDPLTHKAYVSNASGAEGVIDVYDGNTLEKESSISVANFGTTMSLDVDAATGDLYTVSLTDPKIARINVRNENKIDVWTVEGVDMARASGVTWDPINRNVWVANQDSNNTVVFNVDSKKATSLPTGGGALNAKYDPVKKLVYVTNRGGGTVTVFNAKTQEVVGNLEVGGYANHVSIDDKGNAYSVNKAADKAEDGSETNRLVKITPKITGDDGDNGGGDNGGGDNGGGEDNPSTGSSDSVKGPFGILLAISGIAALIGTIFSFAIRAGLINKDLIPAQLRQLFRI